MNKIVSTARTGGFLSILALSLALGGCRGMKSEKTPIHPNMNMDQQERKEAQEVNNFFEDGRSMRTPVEGTVARGLSRLDKAYYEGIDENGEWVANMPIDLTKSIVYRGIGEGYS